MGKARWKAKGLSRQIMRARKMLKMSQQEMALRAGLTRQSVYVIEKGNVCPATDTFLMMLEVLWAEARNNPNATKPLARIGRAFQPPPLKKVA